MSVYALADLHLSFGVPGKNMDVFSDIWKNHPKKIAEHWKRLVKEKDLVLLPGDISWAKHLSEALPDLMFIDALPGTKVMIKGNHDYWWSAISKVKEVAPESIHFIQNNVFDFGDISVGGSRLWDTDEFFFDKYIDYRESEVTDVLMEEDDPKERERIFSRELQRLEISLQKLSKTAKHRIVMTHYPPLGVDLVGTKVSTLLERYRVDICVFGHVHSMKKGLSPFYGEKNGVRYIFVCGDFVDFTPVQIL